MVLILQRDDAVNRIGRGDRNKTRVKILGPQAQRVGCAQQRLKDLMKEGTTCASSETDPSWTHEKYYGSDEKVRFNFNVV